MTWTLHEDCPRGWCGCLHLESAPDVHVVNMGLGVAYEDWHEVFRGSSRDDLFGGPLAEAKAFVERGCATLAIAPTTEGSEVIEWSIDTTGGVEKGKPSRLFVKLDDGGILTVDECLTTSSKDSAKRLDTKPAWSLLLTTEQAQWLAEVLPVALAEKERRGW